MLIRTIVAFLAILCLAASASADIGRVKKVRGDAQIERDGQLMAAEPGLRLNAADVLVTGADGQLSVTFIDNSRFSVGPNSRVSLERFEFDTTTHEGAFDTRIEKGSLAIITGQIAKQRPDAMKIRTPTSILGMRGTRLIVEVEQ